MARKKIVAGNWKMNLEFEDAEKLVQAVIEANISTEVITLFFPPFPFIKAVAQQLNQSGKNNLFSGAQNCSEHEKGAYTGEVAACMLRSVECKYVLVGHSERRIYFNESPEQLISKINQILTNKMIPVYCFGENLSDRKSGNHFRIIRSQLSEVLASFQKEQVNEFVLAYEPVWAIGTGETASPQQAQEVHEFVRKELAEMFDMQTADNVSLLYGGSCNAQNAKDLFSCKDVDGGLIGGASLKAEDFCKIINSF
jgi:triosephosphate isomerase (TIM)